MTTPTFADALADPQLLGCPPFDRLDSWARWMVAARALYGEPLADDERAIFTEHTGRPYDPPPGGYAEAVFIVGRQSGKSRVAAALAAYVAITSPREPDRTPVYALLVAQDQRASMRALYRYASAPYELQPLLRAVVSSRTESTLTLTTGCTIAAYPCRPASIRGLRARVAILDELAHFRSSENTPMDTEMLRAVRPTLATTGGKLVVLSSPYWSAGALYDLHRRHFGRADSSTLVWVGTAPAMNATLPADYLQRLEAEDPEAYRSEVLAEFRQGLTALFDADAIAACVADWRELPPVDGVQYHGFSDPSGGRQDAFTLAIGHRDDDRAVVDCMRVWPAPFDPAAVIGEAARVLRSYGCQDVEGDRYAGAFPAEAFRAHGITYRTAMLDRSGLYLELLPAVNAGRVILPHEPRLLRELRGLERRRGSAGRDRVDHVRGAHDDAANAVAGCVYGLVGRPRVPHARVAPLML